MTAAVSTSAREDQTEQGGLPGGRPKQPRASGRGSVLDCANDGREYGATRTSGDDL